MLCCPLYQHLYGSQICNHWDFPQMPPPPDDAHTLMLGVYAQSTLLDSNDYFYLVFGAKFYPCVDETFPISV